MIDCLLFDYLYCEYFFSCEGFDVSSTRNIPYHTIPSREKHIPPSVRVCHRYTVLVSQCPLAVIRWKWKLSHVTLSSRSHLMIAVIDPDLITTDQYSPSLSLIPTTMVSVVPRGTMPATGSAQGPLPCCISIQQSTLSPEIWSVCRICSYTI